MVCPSQFAMQMHSVCGGEKLAKKGRLKKVCKKEVHLKEGGTKGI